jgi:hypothetical protein
MFTRDDLRRAIFTGERTEGDSESFQCVQWDGADPSVGVLVDAYVRANDAVVITRLVRIRRTSATGYVEIR